MAFRVGQKVVCVDASASNRFGRQEIVKGAVYTVRKCGVYDPAGPMYNHMSCAPYMGMWLEEVARPIYAGFEPFGEIPFRASRFRPVKTADISIFRAMLVNPPKEVVDA